MIQKEVTLLIRYYSTQGSSWDDLVKSFCNDHLTMAKAWARAQKVETIDDLLANTEQIEARGERND